MRMWPGQFIGLRRKRCSSTSSGAEHAVRVVFEMARNFVELLADDVRRDDRLIAAFAQAFANELLDDAAHDRALRMPEDEAAAGVLFDREEIEFDAELAMIALLRFLDLMQVRVELVLVVTTPCRRCAAASALCSSPRQYAPATFISLSAPISPVVCAWPPRQRSVNSPIV